MCKLCGEPGFYEYCCGEVTPKADDDYNDEYDDYKGRIERQ